MMPPVFGSAEYTDGSELAITPEQAGGFYDTTASLGALWYDDPSNNGFNSAFVPQHGDEIAIEGGVLVNPEVEDLEDVDSASPDGYLQVGRLTRADSIS